MQNNATQNQSRTIYNFLIWVWSAPPLMDENSLETQPTEQKLLQVQHLLQVIFEMQLEQILWIWQWNESHPTGNLL